MLVDRMVYLATLSKTSFKIFLEMISLCQPRSLIPYRACVNPHLRYHFSNIEILFRWFMLFQV